MRPVDYQVDSMYAKAAPDAVYTYLMSGNGLSVIASNDLLQAGVLIAQAEIRGLPARIPGILLPHGKIPKVLFDLALNAFLAEPDIERYLAVTWQQDGYHIWQPQQKISAARVEYEAMDDVVLDLHSHGTMRAFFSTQDDRDEQGFKLYGVVGRLQDQPTIRLRVGIYGYYGQVKFGDVFDGYCPIEEADEKDRI